jgi:hypothetical protein
MAITAGRSVNDNTNTVAQDTWTDILPAFGTAGFQGCEEIVIQCVAVAALKVAVALRAGIATGSVGADPNKVSVGDTPHRIGVGAANVPDDWFILAIGESIPFAGSLDNKITRVMVAGSGGTATVKWTITKP